MVDWRLDDDLVAFLREALDGKSDTFYDTGDVAEPFPFDVPVVFVVNPVDDALVIFVGIEGVAEDLMVATLAKGVHDKIRSTEIHIGDPKRDQIPIAKPLFQLVVFDAIGSLAVYNFVEVIMFHGNKLQLFPANLVIIFVFCRMLVRLFRLESVSETADCVFQAFVVLRQALIAFFELP